MNDFTPTELATIRADLAECEREAAINEAAKKVADAAVAVEMTRSAMDLIDQLSWDCPYEIRCQVHADNQEAGEIMNGANDAAIETFDDAVREYRALTEGEGNKANDR